MKKTFIFLLGVILIMNYGNLAAKTYTNANFEGELCEITIFMWNTEGFGWNNDRGIEITVNSVNYGGIIKLPYAFDIYEGEETVLIPSGEVLFSWNGHFDGYFGFKIHNTLGELIYTSPDYIPEGVFFTYQNKCIECFPITDLGGVYIPEEHQVNLSWEAPESADLTGFDIYRNDEFIDHLPSSSIFYSDNTAELEDGSYTYCVVPVYPSVCTLEDECITISINVGITSYKDNIMIYPNPAYDVVNIAGADIVNVKIFNNTGQLLLNQHNKNIINISELTNGIYILSIETLTGNTIQKKIIINQ
ncbi:MAG: T9SS type A sorting domain-containing protein [Lentimicrobiaceae bacterium]|nr:T9SS type A sorting domain-containing protein [Lentimicrobiaceae bacterium]